MIVMRPDWQEIKSECADLRVIFLEHVSYEQRRLLPDCSGVYFFVQGESVLYIGSSKNIKNRCSRHSVFGRMDHLFSTMIYYKQYRPREARFAERELIALHRPIFNAEPFCDANFRRTILAPSRPVRFRAVIQPVIQPVIPAAAPAGEVPE